MAEANIFSALKRDHDLHRQLIGSIGKATAPDKKAELFQQFQIEVTAHAAAEEESLYATMLANPDLRDKAQHSVAEHKEIEDYLEELAAMDAGADIWSKTFKKMSERYLHHIDEEEEEMFPAAAKGLDEADETRISAIFAKRKPAELSAAEEQVAGD